MVANWTSNQQGLTVSQDSGTAVIDITCHSQWSGGTCPSGQVHKTEDLGLILGTVRYIVTKMTTVIIQILG